MDQETLDALTGARISGSEMARLSAMVSQGPSMALHQNASGVTSMRVLGVDVTMPALIFGAGCVVLLIAAVRR